MFYAVKNGIKPGIYDNWNDCKKNVDGFNNSKYKKFKSKNDALKYIETPNIINKPDIIDKQIYHIFTDGSCINNGNDKAKGGIGIYFNEKIHDDISEKLDGIQTNNRAELTAIIKAYEIIDSLDYENSIYYIFTDSDYSIKCITEYCEIWEKNKWKKRGGEIKNLDLIQKLWELYNSHENIIFEHVRSHTGKDDFKSKGNERADYLANLVNRI